MRTPTLASTADMQGGSFEEPGPYMYASVHTHTHAVPWYMEKRKKKKKRSDCISCSLMVLMKAFEFFHPVLETPSVCEYKKIDV